jgi:N-acetylneuraminic acid mutarotase
VKGGPVVGSPTDPGAGPARPKGWRKLPAGPLRGRHSASAVWTGREMVVWGGAWRAGNASIWLDDGAAYDPAADRWRRIAASPLAARSEAFIAWTGKEVVVWGGQTHDSLSFGDEFDDGALYDAAKDTWKPMANWPLAHRYGARAVWTGSRLVVWGGASAEAGEDPPPLADGAAYDPSSNRWTKLPAAPLTGRIAPLGAARGNAALLAWGLGAVQNGQRVPVSDSALYDPEHSRWSPAATTPPPPKKTWCVDPSGCVGIDAGIRVVFAGQGLAWDPSADRWSAIAAGPFADPFREGEAQAWTGTRVMVWGGGTTDSPGDVPPATVAPGGAAYDPAADRWEPLPGAPLTPRARATAVWTGRELLVWGGEADYSHRAQFDDGAAYTP